MTSKEIDNLIRACEWIPGAESETRRLLDICEALNKRIDELERNRARQMSEANYD